MLDDFFDTITEDSDTVRPKPPRHIPAKRTAPPSPSFEEELFHAAELGHTVYGFHGNPDPVELMKLLNAVDGTFLERNSSNNLSLQALPYILDTLW